MSGMLFAAMESYSPSVFNPASPTAGALWNLFLMVLAITAAIFVLVGGFTIYSVIRFRGRPGDEQQEAPQVYGSNRLELAWTILPLLIVFVIFLVVTRTVVSMRSEPSPSGTLMVRVIGHQWWWTFEYPHYHFVTANEMHVPVSTPADPQSVLLRLESADVVHSFWVAQLAGKTDLIPGRVNTMSFVPTKVGIYHGQCSEYCGMQHSMMLILVIVESPEDFERWCENQAKPAVDDPGQAEGAHLFFTKTCFNCHQIRGTLATGSVGPDLTHLMSRQTIGAGAAANTPKNLTAWVTNPQAIKPGCRMPDLKLEPRDVQLLVSYLETLR
jgi:cytochrome c oxidase subunit II